MTRNLLKSTGLCAVVTLALALTACFNLPMGLGKKAEAQQYTADGRPLINLQISIGGGGGTSKSLSPELAEKYFNYFEVVFADTRDSGSLADAAYYRASGFTNQTVKLAVPGGLYDNSGAKNYAIMMAGVRNLSSGECTLLATGIIAAHEGGTSGEPAAQIGPNTTRVTFKLTALSAEIKAAPDSAFVLNPHHYGTTKINGREHPFFPINTPAIAGAPGEDTEALLTLSGWGNGTGENDTQQFIHLVHNGGEEFNLAGIGTKTDDGDEPLPSTAGVTWQISNTAGVMTGGNTSIKVRFNSRSTEQFSGMAWLPVRAPVQAFGPGAGTQVWQVGSGILRDQLDAGAGTEGAGIVILHGKKMTQPGVGAEQDWLWEYVLDLSAPPQSVAGMWTLAEVPASSPPTIPFHYVYTLLGEKAKTRVRITGNRANAAYDPNNPNYDAPGRIAVAAGADIWVVLDDVTIDMPGRLTFGVTGSAFRLLTDGTTGAKVRMTLADGTDNALITATENAAGLHVPAGTSLTIDGLSGKLTVETNASGVNNQGGAGIGSAKEEDCGNITIAGGIVSAKSARDGAGIGGGYRGACGTITITGGWVTAYGGKGSSYGSPGIGSGCGGQIGPSPQGSINISGGVVVAVANKDTAVYGSGAGIGGGGRETKGDTVGSINISGGVVIAMGGPGYSNKGQGAGIGGGGGKNNGGEGGLINITGGTIYAKSGGGAAAGIGNGAYTNSGSDGAAATGSIDLGKAVIFADSINHTSGAYTAGGNLTNGILVGADLDLGSPFINFTTFPALNPIVVQALASFTVPATASLTVPSYMELKLSSAGGTTLTNNGTIELNGTVFINHAGNTLLNNGTINIIPPTGTLDNSAGGTVTNNGIINQ